METWVCASQGLFWSHSIFLLFWGTGCYYTPQSFSSFEALTVAQHKVQKRLLQGSWASPRYKILRQRTQLDKIHSSSMQDIDKIKEKVHSHNLVVPFRHWMLSCSVLTLCLGEIKKCLTCIWHLPGAIFLFAPRRIPFLTVCSENSYTTFCFHFWHLYSVWLIYLNICLSPAFSYQHLEGRS